MNERGSISCKTEYLAFSRCSNVLFAQGKTGCVDVEAAQRRKHDSRGKVTTMAVKPYPSNLIIFYVDERTLDHELTLAIRRSWTHIGDILVRPRPAEEGEEPLSYIHVMVKFGTRHYLPAGDEQADENWADRIEHHLLSSMRKIGNNCIAFNRQQRKTGNPEIPFEHIEFSLEAGALTLEFRLDSNCSLPESCAEIATQIRTTIGEGKLGEPVRVRVPSRASYARQAQAAALAKAEEEARAAEEEAARLAAEAEEREQAEEEAAERFMESPEMAEEVRKEEEQEAAEQPHSPLEVAPLTPEEWEALYGVPDVDFAIDYDIWEAVYADGTSREFDPEAGAFLEQEGER